MMWGWIVAAAMTCAAIVGLLEALHFWRGRKDARAQLENATAASVSLASDLATARDQRDRLNVRNQALAQERTEWERRFHSLEHTYEEAIQARDDARAELARLHKAQGTPAAETQELPAQSPDEPQYEVLKADVPPANGATKARTRKRRAE